MNFHFVDQILELVPGRRAVAIKHVTPFDYYLTQGLKEQPALMSCIVGEALGQLCSWNVIKATEAKMRSVAGIVSEVNLHHHAYVGDSILLEVNIEELDDQAVNWNGVASIRGEQILEVKSSVGPCLPMTDFNDPAEVLQHLHILERPCAIPEYPASDAIIMNHFQDAKHVVNYDRIIHWESGNTLTAQKNISLLAPYFVDHFPRKPVLPVSILLESNLQLGYQFLGEFLGEEFKCFYPRLIRRLKISEFIQPGETFYTKLTLKEQTPEKLVLSYRSEINQKRFCVSEAEFVRYS